MIAFGFLVLRLPPDAFWALTPRELATILRSRPGADPLGRAGLADLMTRFPDDRGDRP